MIKKESYLAALQKRRARARVHTKHQLLGLIMAELLEDREHKSLYIKLAKTGDVAQLMEIARDVSDREPIDRRGAYFMRVVEKRGLLPATERAARQGARQTPQTLRKPVGQKTPRTAQSSARAKKKKKIATPRTRRT